MSTKTPKYSNLERLFEEIKKSKASIKRTQARLADLETQVNNKLGKFGLRYRDL